MINAILLRFKMPGHKVVIRYNNGSMIKGWIENFNPNREIFFLQPLKEYSEQAKLDIKITDTNLKAIFFVKDFIGNSEYQKIRSFQKHIWNIPSQRRIIIYFKDGEKLYGSSYGYNPTKTGFFVYPIDSEDNNIRIFVINSAIEKVEFPDSSDGGINF